MKAVQHFVGFMTYLTKFLPCLSKVCEPLRRLMDKDVVCHWLPKHDATVKEMKQLVTTPVLHYYDLTKAMTIQNDSSQHDLGPGHGRPTGCIRFKGSHSNSKIMPKNVTRCIGQGCELTS